MTAEEQRLEGPHIGSVRCLEAIPFSDTEQITALNTGAKLPCVGEIQRYPPFGGAMDFHIRGSTATTNVWTGSSSMGGRGAEWLTCQITLFLPPSTCGIRGEHLGIDGKKNKVNEKVKSVLS